MICRSRSVVKIGLDAGQLLCFANNGKLHCYGAMATMTVSLRCVAAKNFMFDRSTFGLRLAAGVITTNSKPCHTTNTHPTDCTLMHSTTAGRQTPCLPPCAANRSVRTTSLLLLTTASSPQLTCTASMFTSWIRQGSWLCTHSHSLPCHCRLCSSAGSRSAYSRRMQVAVSKVADVCCGAK
jgi:hypothetical protein